MSVCPYSSFKPNSSPPALHKSAFFGCLLNFIYLNEEYRYWFSKTIIFRFPWTLRPSCYSSIPTGKIVQLKGLLDLTSLVWVLNLVPQAWTGPSIILLRLLNKLCISLYHLAWLSPNLFSRHCTDCCF